MASNKTLSVGVIGFGGVGKAFIKQLGDLRNRYSAQVPAIDVRLVLLATSKRALYTSEYTTLSCTDCGAALDNSQQTPLTILDAIEFLSHAPGKAVLVDNTSSQQVADAYPRFLRSGINICTPNKKAFSGSTALWNDIKTSASTSGAKFYHESSVGAGLPVISTLTDLMVTGDAVTRIEGVFSGTMSFLFNSFAPLHGEGGKWSVEVKKAQRLGFTEPDPRDDLNGLDVARKLLILARIAGLEIDGTSSFPVQSLIPTELQAVATGAEFLDRLSEFDGRMDELKADAEKEGKLVRFVGSIDFGTKNVKVGVDKIDRAHPIAGLQGSDNIISFHTERYGKRPLIIQGAGAGAEVTAMGVTSDLVKIIERCCV